MSKSKVKIVELGNSSVVLWLGLPLLPLQRHGFQSLFGELRSHMPCCVEKKKSLQLSYGCAVFPPLL